MFSNLDKKVDDTFKFSAYNEEERTLVKHKYVF